MTSLVIGASGQVGALLHRSCSQDEPCVGTFCRHAAPGLRPLDLRDHEAITSLIREIRPAVCYLPAALTFMDYAEAHPQECLDINVAGVANLAGALAKVAGMLVFFSTEHVFGDNPRPLREEEPTEALGVYARSKALAEEAIRDHLPESHLILRTSWVFGPDPQRKNFFWRVHDTLGQGKPLPVAQDQHGQPTYGPDLARTARRLVAEAARGTFHVVGPEYLSRLAWAAMIAEGLELPAPLIQGWPTSALPPMAPRPLQVRLDRRKLIDFLGMDPIRPPRDGVRRLARELSCTV